MLHSGEDPLIATSLCDAFLQEVPALLKKTERLFPSCETGSDSLASLHHPIHTLKSCLKYVCSQQELQLAEELEQMTKSNQSTLPEFRDKFIELETQALVWVAKVRLFRSQLQNKQKGQS